MLFLPELTLLGSGLILFLMSLGNPKQTTIKEVSAILCGFVLAAALLSLGKEGSLFYNSYKIDMFSQVFKVFIALSALIVSIITGSLKGIESKVKAEYYLFLFISILGLMMLVSSVELLAIFVSLELSSFAVYIMVAMRNEANTNGNHTESAIKYLLFGVMATGFMLFGMSYMYGLTGSTDLAIIADKLPLLYGNPAAVISLIMVIAGFFYKLALFPFHFWVPDVYEGASNETTAFIATVPKIAAVAMLLRVVTLVTGEATVIVNLLMICAIASMFYGNLSALGQKDLKRMLGFSGIAHAGFVLLGLLTLKETGYSNSLYYISGYVIMNLACFAVICSISKDGKNLAISDLAGLHKRAPLMALTLTIGLFALAGIPPFVGFMGKFMLLAGALKEGYLLLVVLAAINTAIAIYYYLSVVKVTYCGEPNKDDILKINPAISTVAIMLLLVIIYMGVAPNKFLDLTMKTVQTIM